MLARNALIFKWSVYLGTMFVVILLQTLVLEHLVIGGVFPFIYPAVVAVMATYERPDSAAAYGMVLGGLCDIMLPATLPYLYTLVFPVTAILCTLIAKNLLKAGFLCSGACTVLSFSILGLFQCLVLTTKGQHPWALGLAITGQELALSFLLMIPLTFTFRFIADRARYD